MRNGTGKCRDKIWKPGIVVVLLAGTLGLGIYLVRVGSTDSWPETNCTVAGSRVVRVDVADSFRVIVTYKGEYQLRYVAGGHEYYVWVNSGWSDVDKQFVQAKLDFLPDHCEFRVHYNPNRPSESVAVRK